MKITHLLAGNGHDDRTSPLVVAEGNASKPPAPPPESSSSEVPSYTAKGEPAVIGGKALPGSASHAAEVSASAPPPSEASSQNVSHAFVSYDSAGQSILVGPGHIHAPSGGGLPDGVYVGFNIPGVDKNTVPHEYVEVIINSQKTIFEYGPSGRAPILL
ncbi:MAG: hypothetical protein HKL92_10645 [Candidatus Eremiobacteraeota bacterium]|nr:hypothetical protein [Candidatus Eremiobacteraeota bacterium]